MKRWALLADPETYGWKELVRDGRAVWDGITNSRAQQNLRACGLEDVALVYNTAPDKAIMGTARIVRASYPDPNAPERVVIDIEPITALKRPLPLSELKADAKLAEMSFVKMARVAVQPITDAQWDRVMSLSGTDPGASIGADPATAGGP
jgi:predicted RNA-binding protein with PUA-like domain